MAYAYDDQNIFAKILRGEIPNRTVMETEHSLAFEDISPRAPQHVLVIPKGPYVTYDHFAAEASDAEILDYTRTVAKVAQQMGVTPDAGAGYRMLSNAGPDGHQEVPHLHIHIFAGTYLGEMIDVPAAQ
ncbi:histidine triad (HIT) family protein [Monaibacterium marinum]|uniref:Histidine triad (HIT) family protein n=1 Tax=Pontivivens marinum TaxID=1690039 RepID=A0A2C9CPT8_9RHOB|nr:HIT domain-containing protein [Monaibacterium marinum]SOH93233.1 histidine triad (HIT) family protein [Monaibacterium marinum]